MSGFGTQPGDFGGAGVPVPPPPESNEQQLVDDIHQIKVKYVDGHTNFRTVLQLAALDARLMDMRGQTINCLILTAATGVIFAYLFDVSTYNGVAAPLPDLAASAGVVPTTVQIMIPERDDYQIGIHEGVNAAATGTLRACKI